MRGPTLPVTGKGGIQSVAAQLVAATKSLTQAQPVLLFVASTGAGKSKIVPSLLAKEFGPTYAITPAKADVKSMAAWATVSCAYRVGGASAKGPWNAMLRIETAGLACKTHLGAGSLLTGASVVILDEVDVTAESCGYACLFEACLREARIRPEDRPLRIVVTSATPGENVEGLVHSGDAKFFEFEGRAHEVETAEVHCSNPEEALLTLSAQTVAKGHSALLFCLGEEECEKAVAHLKNLGVCAEAVHAKMESDDIEKALTPKDFARVLCGTSIAERAITHPDITFALDPGFSRRFRDEEGIRQCSDEPSPPSVSTQRRGRVGRVRPGVYIKAVQMGTRSAAEGASSRVTVESVMEGYALEMATEGTRLCPVPPATAAAASLLVVKLFPSRSACQAAYKKYPTSLFSAAVLEAAVDAQGAWDVRYEAAALVAMLETGACKKGPISVETAIKAVEELLPAPEAKEVFALKRLAAARLLHHDICSRLGVWRRSSMTGDWLNEALALVFLRTPLQLAVCRYGVAHVAGHPVKTAGPGGTVVLVGVRQPKFGTATATFELPVSAWVQDRSNISAPTATASCVGDSTVKEARLAVFFSLRDEGYDLVCWNHVGGIWETEVPKLCQSATPCDLLLCFPNGNRLALQERPQTPVWMAPLVTNLLEAAGSVGKAVAFFIGDATLSPGLPHIDIYRELVVQYQQMVENAGGAVTRNFPGKAPSLLKDGIHWKSTCTRSVQDLIKAMVSHAAPVKLAKENSRDWSWRRMADGRHYPFCLRCEKFLDETHLTSTRHKQLCGAAPLRAFCITYCHTGRFFQDEMEDVSPACADEKLRQRREEPEAEPVVGQHVPHTLPPGWAMTTDSSTGRPYYFHMVSRQPQWELPTR